MSPALGPTQSPYDNDRNMLDEGEVDDFPASTEPQHASYLRTDKTPYAHKNPKWLHETFVDRLRLNRGPNIAEYWNWPYVAGLRTESAAVHETWPESGERMHIECEVDHSTDSTFPRGMGDIYEYLTTGPTSNDRLAKSPTPTVNGNGTPRKRPSKTPRSEKSKEIKEFEARVKKIMTKPLSVDTDLLRDTPVIDMTWKAHRSREVRHAEPRNRNGDPKRPMNCFMFYRSGYTEKAKKWLEGMDGVNKSNNQFISAATSISWKMESEQVKERCKTFAAADKAGFDDAFPDHKYCPNNNKSRKVGKEPSTKDTGRGQKRTQSRPAKRGNRRRKQERPPTTKGLSSSGGEIQSSKPYYTERAPLVAQVEQTRNDAAQEQQQAPDVLIPATPYYFTTNVIELSMSDSSLLDLSTNEQETYSWQSLENNHGTSSSFNGPLTPTFSLGAIDPTLTLQNSQEQYSLHENEKFEDFDSYFKEESDAILQATSPLAQAAANQLWFHMGT